MTTEKRNNSCCDLCGGAGVYKDLLQLPNDKTRLITKVCECPKGLAKIWIYETSCGPFDFRYIVR